MSKADILSELPRLNREERREILEQLCALAEAELTPTHQAWIEEALASGPAAPASSEDWANALERGLSRGRRDS